MLAELRRRSDFREHSAPNLVFFNGQSQTVAQQRPRNYVRSYRSRPQENAWMGYDVDWAQITGRFHAADQLRCCRRTNARSTRC